MRTLKVLWLTNKLLPEVSEAIGSEKIVNEGWLCETFNKLIDIKSVEMVVVSGTRFQTVSGKTEKFKYYTFDETRKSENYYSAAFENMFFNILMSEKPDLIHIWGSEYPHTLAMVNAGKKAGYLDRMVISVQGVISVLAQHYCCGLSDKTVNSHTLYEFLRKSNISNNQKAFARRGELEIKAFETVKHVIGRTDFDLACTKMYNPDVKYHFCNETLRKEFYDGKWSFEDCRPHSIFVSQAGYPVKGMHYLLEAAAILKIKYPDLIINIAGSDITKNDTVYEKLRFTSYGKYAKRKISEYGLKDTIKFTGKLDAEKMKKQYLNANVFVSCSNIENSPNSVGEAMLLGTPVVSSDVGGVKNMFVHEEDGYIYQHNAPYMLAFYIQKIFENKDIAEKFSENERCHARKTHNPEVNFTALLDVYRDITDIEISE